MSFYVDASVLVALLVPEPFSTRADRFLQTNLGIYIVSDFAAAEFSSAISRRVRMATMSPADARIALSAFDSWAAQTAQRVEIVAPDIATASSFLRRLDLPLLTPDAIHIAATQRLGATLVTFDRQMTMSAGTLGIAVAIPP